MSNFTLSNNNSVFSNYTNRDPRYAELFKDQPTYLASDFGGGMMAGTTPFVPLTVNGKEYVYTPQSFVQKGLLANDQWVYSPLVLNQSITGSMAPVKMDKSFADSLVNNFKDTNWGPSFNHADDPTSGYLIPRDVYDEARFNYSKDIGSLSGYTGTDGADTKGIKNIPDTLAMKDGQYVYAKGNTWADASGQVYNYTPASKSRGGFGGFLDDVGLGGISDAIQDLGPIGQIGMAVATGGLSLPEQFAAMAAYNSAGGSDLATSLKQAALSTALSQGAQALGGSGATSSEGLSMPFSEIMEIPTAELLSGYEAAAGGAAGLSGLDMGDTIPFTDAQVEGLYPIDNVFTPPAAAGVADTTGLDMGEVIPATKEQIAGLYPENGTFLPKGYAGTEGFDTGDVIPANEEQLAGLYPTDNTFGGVPVEDLSTAATGNVASGGMGNALAGAALGGMAGALVQDLIPQMPDAPSYTPKPKSDPDLTAKFDTPVKQLDVPESFNFQFSNVANPYLAKSVTGNVTGPMLFDPSQQYSSALIQGLRAASNAPAFANPGFTNFQTTK